MYMYKIVGVRTEDTAKRRARVPFAPSFTCTRAPFHVKKVLCDRI